MPKIVTRQVLIGERGIIWLAGIVLDMGCLWHPTGKVEAGIDGFIEMRDPTTGQALNSIVLVQSKATTQAFVGRPATPKAANRYLGKSVAHYFRQGNRNPVTYANC
jgi:hypothetical protein